MVSKITKITQGKPYDSQHGTLYGFFYTFEDGTNISANHKTVQSPFQVGDEAEYEITGTFGKDGKRGKVGKPKDQQFLTLKPIERISSRAMSVEAMFTTIDTKLDLILGKLDKGEIPF